jgi:CHAT domain-containing protein
LRFHKPTPRIQKIIQRAIGLDKKRNRTLPSHAIAAQVMLKQRLLSVLFLMSLMLCLGLGHVSAQIVNSSIQQGLERYRSGDFQGAIDIWNNALKQHPNDQVILLKYLARVYSQVGQFEPAIASLNALIDYYQNNSDRVQLGRMLTEQAQAYSNLGQQRQAIAILCGEQSECKEGSALAIARQQSDPLGEAAGLGSLGNAYRLQGDYESALRSLQKSLNMADKLQNSAYRIAAKNGLGNTYASLAKRDYRYAEFASETDDRAAKERFTQQAIESDRSAIQSFTAVVMAARQQNHPTQESQALLNLATSYQRSGLQTEKTLQQADNLRDRLPDSRDKAYHLIRLANLWQQSPKLDPNVQCGAQTPAETVPLLKQAIVVAQRIRDPQAESFALGRLGHHYECQQDFTQALQLTQQAQFTAQNQSNRYLWDWQIGRILQTQGRTAAAIAAYESAVKALKEIRGDLAIASRDFQFDFRDVIEPVYRELTELQLQATANQTSEKPTNLESALETIDSLRLAEVQNYLGEDCTITATAKPITLVNDKTAIFSTIMLKNRIAVIVTLPKSRSMIRWIPAQSQTVTATVNDLRLKLEQRSDLANTYQAPAQQIYDWLIRPFSQDLQAAQIETLVFIQDGILRSIPMTALYDGKQFLVEQYAIANTLSLTLIDPTQLNQGSLRVLGFGLTKASTIGSTFFAPLSFVKTELDRITKTLPGSKEFIDEAFTIDRLKQELTQNAFPIVHLATHGKFGIDSRETFLVTGKQISAASKPDNEKLTMNQLYQILQTVEKPLDLLTLTACETAVGSNRDALGIAGISIQAGAKSAIASLWQVDDQATAELIAQFYQNLNQGMGRAKALQSAQKSWLQKPSDARQHPGYWAALTLVGNWL